MQWQDIEGWFQWRSGQEEAVQAFAAHSRFVEVGSYLGRSLCSLGDIVTRSGKAYTLVGIDTCRGSGPEGPRQTDYHAAAVDRGGGTFAGTLHANIVACGFADCIALIVSDSLTAAALFADATLDWVHLDARHDYASVAADIGAWRRKVRIGGWLTGDDYDDVKWPGVVRAVSELLPDARPWSEGQWRWIVS